jgi:putative ATPase
MRPKSIEEFVGHQRWTSSAGVIGGMLTGKPLRSSVFWGPPGCGKTTLARLLADQSPSPKARLSAVLDGVNELRNLVNSSQQPLTPGLVVIIDEIHRWNKAQQDALLPHVENGTITLLGATTENPAFHLNSALVSRVTIVRLEPLADKHILTILETARSSSRGLGGRVPPLEGEVTAAFCGFAAGDARRALSLLERCADAVEDGEAITLGVVKQVVQDPIIRHDRSGTDHFSVISALIKSMRGSDPDAALYWLARLIEGGEDVAYIGRRLIIFASEDVGNADPRALQVAVDALAAAKQIGLPEARICLAQAVTWLACAPKSNAAYLGIDRAIADVRRLGALSVPAHLQPSASQPPGTTAYAYPHDFPYRVARQQYLPTELEGQRYYEPAAHGDEKLIAQRLAWWKKKLDERG